MFGEFMTWFGVASVALVTWRLYLSATQEVAEEAAEAESVEEPELVNVE